MAGRDTICMIEFDEDYFIHIYYEHEDGKWYFSTQEMRIELTEEISRALAGAINGLIKSGISSVTAYQVP